MTCIGRCIPLRGLYNFRFSKDACLNITVNWTDTQFQVYEVRKGSYTTVLVPARHLLRGSPHPLTFLIDCRIHDGISICFDRSIFFFEISTLQNRFSLGALAQTRKNLEIFLPKIALRESMGEGKCGNKKDAPSSIAYRDDPWFFKIIGNFWEDKEIWFWAY